MGTGRVGCVAVTAPYDPFGLGPPQPVVSQPVMAAPAPVHRPDAAAASPRRRGGTLRGLVMIGAVATAVTLGVSGYLALATIDITSTDPFGPALAWTVVAAVAALVAVGVVLLGIVAVIWCRPRGLAALGLVAALVLPVAAVLVAVPAGFHTARQKTADELTVDGGVADRVVDLADTWNVHLGPARDLLRAIIGTGSDVSE